ncbi:MAG: hypothetical protein SCAL_000069 [Candidatus Syntrophoarchaeum caldarius]|uniref:Uncharacterized protein n=1 Tax=Candidatus Syntropharchaeum caldarium TaxID=1838285 RepID=A0A1F2PAW1_9EURY|nr:MAG: hypothetical protein SCAL_000069 [Candidatus Syntrophoarchaeum caldarius]
MFNALAGCRARSRKTRIETKNEEEWKQEVEELQSKIQENKD